MKKILMIFVLGSCFLLSGCKSYSEDDVIKELKNKIEKSNSYYLEGEMEIINNEDIYTYNVNVSYQKDDNYKVELTNIANNHKQVILRNDEGVYV